MFELCKLAVDQLIESKIEVVKNVNLKEYTSTKTGGNVLCMIYPNNVDELKKTIQILKENTLSYLVLGGMTNIAVSSNDLNIAIINMTKFTASVNFDRKTNILKVSADVEMKKLARWALDNSIAGLQWMEGIPGTVGAGVYMNAGFLSGQDFGSFLVDALVLMPDCTLRTFTNRELNYGYRRSVLQTNGGIVISARFLLRIGKKWKIRIRMHQYHTRRRKNQPLEYPSAGTVFVPPTPYHVGGMLRELNLLGKTIGGAQISQKSPGFIINTGNMTGEDYYKMIKFIQREVRDNYGIKLEPEVRLIGFSDNEK